MPASDLNRQFEALRGRLVAVARDLIRVDTSNPPGDTREISGYIAELLRSEGIDCRHPAADDHRPGVMATLNPGGRPNLLLHSHLDTAPVGDPEKWHCDPFGGELKSGRLYGLGSSDSKGSVAAMVLALIALSRCDGLSGSLTLNLVADEETGGELGMAYLIREGLVRPDLAVVGESTANRIAIAERGMLWMEITVRGRTAHASAPWEGINAISKMVRFLSWMESELASRFAERHHALTPPPTLNIGLIEGGIRPNVVADRCRVVVDRRVLPTESLDGAASELEELLEEMRRRDPEFEAKLHVAPRHGLPFETDQSHPLVVAAAEVCGSVGVNAQPVGYRQASDARFLAEIGTPTVILGPGLPERVHRPNEYVVVEDLDRAARIYALLATRLLASEVAL